MNCTECGQDIEEDRFGNLIHTYQTWDAHTPIADN
jgi:hypothetical protein